jgi:uncharacterized protein (TIGR01777 family)
MRVAISGGTGFVGSHLVPALLGRGDEVILLVREQTNTERVERLLSRRPAPGGSVGRARTARLAEGALGGVEAVVNLAGAGVMDRPWTDERLALIRSSRVDTTRRLAREAKDARVFVSASAVGYYGMRTDDAELDESSPPGDDVLARICVDWEAAARTASCRVAIARTGIVLGKGGGALARMVTMFRRFVGGPLGSGKQWWSWIHVDDLVRAYLFAIDTPSFEGPFDATAPAPARMDDVARELGRALHRPSALRAPAAAMRLTLGRRADVLLTGQRVLPRKLVAAGFEFRYPDLAGAIAAAV